MKAKQEKVNKKTDHKVWEEKAKPASKQSKKTPINSKNIWCQWQGLDDEVKPCWAETQKGNTFCSEHQNIWPQD